MSSLSLTIYLIAISNVFVMVSFAEKIARFDRKRIARRYFNAITNWLFANQS